MSTLILGAHGQVGWELRRALGAQSQVLALTRDEADLAKPASLIAALERIQPSTIINAAAYTAVDKAESEPDVAERVNHHAVAEMAAYAKSANALLIHYSTDYVFDGAKPAPYVEDDPTGPLGVYGATKLRGEMSITHSGCRHIIFRTSWVYAARGANFVKTILRLAAAREELTVVADQWGAPTSAALIADVTALAMARPGLQGIYHLTASGETSWHGFATLIVTEAARAGLALKATPDKVRAIPTSAYPTAARRPTNSRLNTNKLRTSLGIDLPLWDIEARRIVRVLVEESKN